MILENDIDISADSETRLQKFFLLLGAFAIIGSAFHFWPFQQSRLWQIMNLSNLACLTTVLLLAALYICGKNRNKVVSFLPHVSIFAYLIINFLSMAFAAGFPRSASFIAKLAIVFVGGFYLFVRAASNEKSIKAIYKFIVIALLISVSYCLFTRLSGSVGKFGFHGNVFKYGTYIGILTPLGATYLISESTRTKTIRTPL